MSYFLELANFCAYIFCKSYKEVSKKVWHLPLSYLCNKPFYCLYQQGRRATISFLKHYVHNNNLPKKVITTSTLPQTTPIPPVNHITESQQATDGDDHVSMSQTTVKVDAGKN